MWWMWILATATAADMNGTWAIASSEAEVQRSIDQGISRSVSGMPRMYQSIARGKLEDIPNVCDAYTFTIDDQAVAWACDGEKHLSIPREYLGKKLKITRDGKTFRAVVTLDGDTMNATFLGDKGDRVMRFAFDGDALWVSGTVQGEQLTVPLQWTVRYARPKAQDASAATDKVR